MSLTDWVDASTPLDSSVTSTTTLPPLGLPPLPLPSSLDAPPELPNDVSKADVDAADDEEEDDEDGEEDDEEDMPNVSRAAKLDNKP